MAGSVFSLGLKNFYFFVSVEITILVLFSWLRNMLFSHTPEKQCGFGVQMR